MVAVFRLLVALVIGVGLVSCGGPAGPDDGGSGSAPEGIIMGTLLDAGGTPLAGEQVTVTPSTPISVASIGAQGVTTSSAAVTTTNARGEFAFDVDQEGTYVLTNLGDTTGALARVAVTRGADGRLASAGDVAMTALELGAVTGRVAGRGSGVMVFLSGTSFLALTAADGSFVIGRVPVGSYEAVAGIAGAVGAAVPVTVTAGAAVALSEDLRLGPVVTGVSPEGFVPYVIEWPGSGAILEPSAFVIRGSGFGERQGLSRLVYAGEEVPVLAIDSWSETEIVVAVERWTSSAGWDNVGAIEEFRFTVTTVAGEAITPVTGSYWLEVGAHETGWPPELSTLTPVLVELRTYLGYRVFGARVGVSVVNGGAEDTAGTAISEFVTGPPFDAGDLVPSFYVRPLSWLPVIATLDPTVDPAVTAGAPERFLIRGGVVELDDDTYVAGPNSLSGRVLAADGVTAMPDDGDFTVRVYTPLAGWYGCGFVGDLLASEPLALGGDGSWSIGVDVSAGLLDDGLCVAILYGGVELESRELYLVE